MPRTFRHSLLVALLLGFVPASVLNNFAAPLPPAAPQAAAQDSLYKRLGGYLRCPGRGHRRLSRPPGH
ncbi:MAG: hypothetical protein ACXVZH_10545 [Terriglobales bacterium]